jgi:hypothetical protein
VDSDSQPKWTGKFFIFCKIVEERRGGILDEDLGECFTWTWHKFCSCSWPIQDHWRTIGVAGIERKRKSNFK